MISRGVNGCIRVTSQTYSLVLLNGMNPMTNHSFVCVTLQLRSLEIVCRLVVAMLTAHKDHMSAPQLQL